jgi:hypothetical protein
MLTPLNPPTATKCCGSVCVAPETSEETGLLVPRPCTPEVSGAYAMFSRPSKTRRPK